MMSDENVNESPVIAADLEEEEESSRKKGLWWRFKDAISRARAWLAGLTRRQRLQALIAAVIAALVIVLGILAWYLIFRKPITDLPGLNIEVSPVYSYSVSGVERPLGIAIDEEHNRVYVTQSDGARTVKVFDASGNPLGELQPPDDGFSHTSTYVAVDPKTKNVYVTDRGANQLYVYSADGKYLRTVMPDTVKGWGPLGITFDKEGLLYVGDANASPQVIWVLKTNGQVVRKFGQPENISYPNGLAVYADGTVAVADSNHTQVLIYNADGTYRGKLAKGEADAALGLPRGLAIGAKDRLYVVDTTNAIVRIFRPAGDGIPEYATYFGVIGQREGEFLYPNGVATDEHGHIFVTDRENNRWQVWTNR
jgi:tripartite motif-containing protein 71